MKCKPRFLSKIEIRFLFGLIIFTFNWIDLQGQEIDTAQYRLEMVDGNSFTGTILSMDSIQVVMSSDQIGVINISRDQIVILEKVDSRDFYSQYYNLQSARYLFSPNGYGLRKGEGYYQNVWVLYNQVSYGFSDHFSLGVGTLPIFLFGADVVPVWLTPKVSIPIVDDRLQLGAGAFMGAVLGDDFGFGILYGTATVGSRSKNLTLGLGYGYAEGEWASHPAVSLSGMLQTSPRGFLITENYLISAGGESLVLMSLAGRRLIRKVGLDFGGILPISNDIDRFILIPWLGITFPF